MYAASGILTNTVPTAAYRGAGRPEATYTIERIIDIAARELGISPYRAAPDQPDPARGDAVQDRADLHLRLRRVRRQHAEARGDGGAGRLRRASRRSRGTRGKLRGIGLCNCIEVAGGPFLRPAKDQAALRLAEDGTLVLRSGSMSVGQGLETAFCQLVAERFGVPLEHVRYEAGDTDLLSGGKGNGGSGALCIGGSAVSSWWTR